MTKGKMGCKNNIHTEHIGEMYNINQVHLEYTDMKTSIEIVII